MATLLHFVATWAESICDPHRSEVVAAAAELGLESVEVDVDGSGGLANTYAILNVPAVAIEGQPGSRVVGAKRCQELVDELRPYCD